MTSPRVDRTLEALWPTPPSGNGADVFALLDGARDRRIYWQLGRSLSDQCCLYLGDLPRELAEVAPYLVALARGSQLATWLIEEGLGRSWGVFLSSEAWMSELRSHFRRLLQVTDERGRKLLFRFYDPRVLRVYLPTCNAEELRTVFGPVSRFIIEQEDAESLTEFRLDRDRLVARPLDVSDGTL